MARRGDQGQGRGGAARADRRGPVVRRAGSGV